MIMFRFFPPKKDIAPVFAVIVFLVYGWSIVAFLQKVPSWVLFLRLGEIAIILAYMLVTVFSGSILLTAFLLFFCVLLPSKYFKENFAVQGTLVSLILISSVAAFIYRYTVLGSGFLVYGPLWLSATVVISVLLAYFGVKFRFLGRATFWVADHLTVYLYLVIPLSILSFIVVIFRNVF
jgi:hypothetical protein